MVLVRRRVDAHTLAHNREIKNRFRRGLSGWAGYLLFLAVSSQALWLSGASEKTNTAAPQPHRWLFIVQTSASMQPRVGSLQRIAGAMLASGLNDQMRRGDTLGVWTFNEKLIRGRFPLQEWTPQTSREIAKRVVQFVAGQNYEKQSRFDNVLPFMEHVIEDSSLITVVLFSDGQEIALHTPFDQKINAVYQTWRSEQERAKLPFVTVLRAQNGQISNYSVAVPPWPLTMPPMPPELLPPKPAQTPAPPAPHLAAPLIVTGKKAAAPPEAQPSESLVTNAPPQAPAPGYETTADEVGPATTTGMDEPAPPASAPPTQTVPLPEALAQKENNAGQLPTVEPQDHDSRAVETIPSESVVGTPEVPPLATSAEREAAPLTVDSAQPPQSSTPAQVAAVAPALSSRSAQVRILVLGGVAVVLAAVALAVVLRLVRRLRAPNKISLITRSLERKGK